MLKTVPIADFKIGIDMLSDETSLPRGACRDAVNVDIDIYGNFRTRSGFTQLASMTGAHSLIGSRDGTFGFYAKDDKLLRVVVQNGGPLEAVVLAGLTPSERMSYFEYADQMFFTNGHQLGVVTRTQARLLGVADPIDFGVDPLNYGTLPAGMYDVAYSFVLPSGEESGLSQLQSVELVTSGGFEVLVPPVQAFNTGAEKLRVYATTVNGDILYLAGEFSLRMSGAYEIVEAKFSKQADNVQLHRMPAGSIVRAYNGRVVVARGNELWFSEPYRYGLTSRRHNFVSFNSEVVMVEPVKDGLYVGVLDGAVYFLAGGGPSEFEMFIASTNGPARYTSCLVQPAALPPKLADTTDSPAAVWLGAKGYSIGLPGGAVKDIQADRIELDASSGSAVTYSNQGIRQVVSIVESTQTAGPGLAVDSVI